MLFIFYWILCSKPFTPSAFEGEDIAVTIGHQLACQTGTGAFVRSGAIQNQGFILGICCGPIVKFSRVGPDSPLDFEFR